MSSSSTIVTLNLISQQITIYLGSIILVIGIIGGILNILVFLSLRTFRESSCAVYLIVMSMANIGQLATGLFRQILVTGFNIDWTQISLFYCKWRPFCFQACMLISLTCVCLATIDQYWSTSTQVRWQQWCNVKLAWWLSAINVLVWHLHGIIYLVYFDFVLLSSGKITCKLTSDIVQQYLNYVLSPVIGRVLPLMITFIFGILAYRNIKGMAYRTVPLVRRELDKQLTTIILIQAVFTCFAILPAFIVSNIISYSTIVKDPLISSILQLINTLTVCLYYLYFASPFYICLCGSERFRRQFLHVIFRIYLNRLCQQRVNITTI